MRFVRLVLRMCSLYRMGTKYVLGTIHQLFLPIPDLVRMDIELLGQFG